MQCIEQAPAFLRLQGCYNHLANNDPDVCVSPNQRRPALARAGHQLEARPDAVEPRARASRRVRGGCTTSVKQDDLSPELQ